MLIFDSGVGGLSVLKTIKKILPNIHYIYVLDNEVFPYGNKTECFIVHRTIKIIQIIKKYYPINIVVIACNTASTIALSILKKKFNFPIIGILPAIKNAEKITKNKIIGLIATQATINSIYTKKLIHETSSFNTIKIISTNQLASISEKKVRGMIFSKKYLKNIFTPWINLNIKPDTIILGCTHFSFLKKEIQDTIYHKKSLINFVDSSETIALSIQSYFDKFNIHQIIKENIFLYSKNDYFLQRLLFFLKKYQFKKIKYINLN
ncbi:glutamate racemase [Buchnera aphidicola (Macrosiphoniella sanborni)]|uniref:Glutamate racemase n=1 Tax=Buchnera aphidicola (Macrosiphoniella sanborni) TaxID=1241865 RepID=A0A4D6Y3B5_9GAMM|nr:glutamate racemase [Buchnera aphidicola]QCI24056.1 glutamate racemase [Buchnera aphidicola (Macrosiphoniella sanborni)]